MKKILLAIILLTITTTISGQDLKSIILSMPESIIYGLEASEKNLLAAGLEDTAKLTVDRGRLGKITRLSVSADFVSFKTSDAGTVEIKLLSLINDSRIICVIRTVCAGACDSQLQFYTTKWIPINKGNLFPEKDKDWFIRPDIDKDSQEFKNAYAALDMNPIRMRLSPTDASLMVYYDIKEYLNEEDYKKIEPFLLENPKILYWDKSSYN
ncbi:MAG: DUF3256 family protein [Prevotella sp.]|jgi:hypothetical protein|nr:DUF3256 family protein [Prevotella sp.]